MAERRRRTAAAEYHSPLVDCLRAVQRGELTIDHIAALSEYERHNLAALIQYEAIRREHHRAARSPSTLRAGGLLRSFLSDAQRRMLDNSRYFHVQGSAGGFYRLIVRTGAVQRIERHGKRWYWMATFCLHDYAEDAPDEKRIPLPDLSLQHMLLLMADEPAFLAQANLSASPRLLWDVEWLRELRRATAERREAAAVAARLEDPPLPLIEIELNDDEAAAA